MPRSDQSRPLLWSRLLLGLAVLALSIGALAAYTVIERSLRLEVLHEESEFWSAAQMEIELWRLAGTIDGARDGRPERWSEELAKRYDIGWSRLSVMVEGEVGARIIGAANDELDGIALFDRYREMEPEVTALIRGEDVDIHSLHAEAASLAADMRAITTRVNFSLIERRAELRQELHGAINTFLGLVIALLFGFVMTIYLLNWLRRHSSRLEVQNRRLVAAAEASDEPMAVFQLSSGKAGTLDFANTAFLDLVRGNSGTDNGVATRGDYRDCAKVLKVRPGWLERVLEAGCAKAVSEPILHLDGGREIWTAIDVTIIPDTFGKPEALLLEVIDKTEEIRNLRLAELQGKELLRSVELRTASLLHEISNPVGTAYVAVSHSLSELGTIEARVRAGEPGADTSTTTLLAEQREAQEMARDNLRQAAELMREFKRLALDQSTIDSERASLTRILETIKRTTAPLLRRARVVMDVNANGVDDLEVATSPMMQVLNNLVINAVRHGLDGVTEGHIDIRARREGETILVSVADNGRGMTEEVKARLFEPYFTTASDRGGTGLGLHIVLEIVRQRFNGTISVVSSLGRGTTFRLSLPVEPTSVT